MVEAHLAPRRRPVSLASVASIALSGLTAATRRLEVSASNLANLATTGEVPGADGRTTVYRALDVHQTAGADGGVDASVVQRSPGWHVDVRPGDPNADAQGRVAAPDVDPTRELSELMMARASYAFSAKVMKAADDMQKTATDMFV